MASFDENRNVLKESDDNDGNDDDDDRFDAFFNSSVGGFCRLSSPSEPPKWLDKSLYLDGVKFFWDHVLAVFLVLCQNLVVGLSVPNLSYPLVLTGQSETISKSQERYAKTGAFIFELYSQLPWEEDSVVQKVNGFHCRAATKVRKMSRVEMKDKVDQVFDNLTDKEVVPVGRLDQVLLDNLQKVSDEMDPKEFAYYEEYLRSAASFSNLDMALVQSAFFAAMVVHPHIYGCGSSSQRQLEGLAHVWRVLGYYLGMPDYSNFVQDTFDETRRLLQDMYRKIFVPSLLRVDSVSMTMGKNIAKAFCIDYHVMMYLTLRQHGIELADLWRNFSALQKLRFHVGGAVLWLYRFAVVRAFLNAVFAVFAKVFVARVTRGRMGVNVGRRKKTSTVGQ